MSEDRLPFVAEETEQFVLGASLDWDGVAVKFVAEGLREQHFWRAHHRTLWKHISALVHEGVSDSMYAAVLSRLAKHGDLEDVRPSYLSRLVDGVPIVRDDGVRELTRRLVECAVGRETQHLLRRALGSLEESPAALTEGFFSALETSLQALSSQLAGRRTPSHIEHVSEVMAKVVESLRSGPPEFVDTPWPALNVMLGGGFAPGELIYFGARPGLGKTAAAIEIARRAAKRGLSVLGFSREMLTEAIGLRMLSQEGPVHASTLRKRDLSQSHWRTIELAVDKLSALPIFLTHAKVSVEDIRRIVGVFRDEGPLGLVIVDYLQLIDAPAGITERRAQVEAVSAGLKAITLDYDVPVLCLSSLARPADGRAPTLASLRESGNLEHDADTVILLHRPEELQPMTEVIVAKSRNGRTGKMELFFRGEFLRFEEQL